ncbi:MAG: glutamine--fructose-6-phosphate transaminase (isomerizing) [Bacillota bacterium]|nr:MAG: glutamine--fructose-6-phosphate transaminase (isomerizing) [Bacillota bacterium]
MCGITGYTGNKRAAPILLDGLKKLEYRGYDSAGIAVRGPSGKVTVVKAKGRLKSLVEKTDDGRTVPGTCGIGHTRWATHGEPSESNAHPHYNDEKTLFGVHNGIIENYADLHRKLTNAGYSFYSQTDTEVAIKLIDYYFKKCNDPLEALISFMLRVRGSYALAVMFDEYPDEIFVARKDSPMIIGVGEGETFLASDVPAILRYTRDVYYIDNMEIARLQKGRAEFYDLDKNVLQKERVHIDWNEEAAERGGFKHFMMKEIHEQPRAVRDTIGEFVHGKKIDLSQTGLTDEQIRSFREIQVVACGSAYHAGMVMQYVTEKLARIPVRVELASEFRYRDPILSEDTLVVVISQSGETADSLAALREAKRRKVPTLAVVNVLGSSIAREADMVFYTKAGPEIAVATTKAYSTQLAAGYLLAVQFAYVRGEIEKERYETLIGELTALPEKLETVLDEKESLQQFAAKIANNRDIFFIGRGVDYAVSMEGSLKLKEISYIHSEAYAAGELKHGTISLIEDGTLVVGVLTQAELIEKTLSNMVEVHSRGAYLMALTAVGNYFVEDKAEFTVYVPKTEPLFSAVLAVVPLQLLAYYVSVARGLDVDKPRNLAKSVTVE